ncbi:ribosome-associated protein [Mergibacter septicus]|nr:ribosome-associated protein [Mergibacter septicus]
MGINIMRHKKNTIDWDSIEAEVKGRLTEEEEEIIWVSKSELKRDAEELKQLGAKLIALPEATLAKIPLDDQLLDAIQLARRLQRESLRRQLQFIGKLLRKCDTDPIYAVLEQIENKHNQQKVLFHQLEQLREQLVADNESAKAVFSQLSTDYPMLDRQHLRNLIRMVHKEKAQNKPPKAFRELFQYLKILLEVDE